MNAPAPIAATAQPSLELIPLADIAPSKTHIQELRRARFDKKALQELADSIKAIGILQPVVVRPSGLATKFELVAGERRWQAAKLAGLAAIPASVRILTPEQVLEVQLIENLQREGLHELEEAEGYEELMKLKKVNADTVAEMVGSKPITRTEITKKLWGYIKRNGLQDKKQRRFINADAKLAAVFGGKKRVSMFDMTQHVGKQLLVA